MTATWRARAIAAEKTLRRIATICSSGLEASDGPNMLYTDPERTLDADAEAEHDIHRERLRAQRHLRMAQRRETHLWPIAAPLIIAGALALAAAIQGGAL